MSMILKYPSITNDYAILRRKRALQFMRNNWFATEKIHGTNVSININKNHEIELGGKRQKAKKYPDQYQGLFKFVENNPDLISKLKELLDNYKADVVHTYGELFGKGIQKTLYDVNKNDTTDVKLFSVIIEKDNEYIVLSRKDIELYLESYLIPIEKIDTLENLLKTDIESQKSQYGDTFEGYVYAPYDFNYTYANDKPFISIKHKVEKFQEVKSKKKKPELSKEQLYLNEDINRYVTKHRIEHILDEFHLELIQQNFGKIIGHTQDDIKKEYLNENDTSQYTEDQIKIAIKNQGREIALTLKQMMKEGY